MSFPLLKYWAAPADRLLRASEGNVAVVFAIVAPVLIGLSGLAIDGTAFFNQQSRMQSVADASALAIAKELRVHREDINELKAIGDAHVEALLTEAGIEDRPHTIEISVHPAVNVIDVQIQMKASAFLPVEVWGDNPIVVSARAQAYGQSKLCILALHTNKSDTIKADSGAVLTANDCAVHSNSTDPKGLNVKDGSRIISTVICSAGGADGEADSFDPNPDTDCPRLDDPLAGRPVPSVGGCDYLDMKIDQTTSISPGTYCGGLTIENGASVSAEPGVYFVTDGKLEVKGASSLTGEFVSFVFDETSLLMFDKETTIDLGAPKEGDMAGILFLERATAPLGRSFEIKSENAHRLLGTIYLPRGKLKIEAKGSVAAESAYTVIVANQVEVKEADLVINSDYGGTDVPVPDGIGPNSSMVRLAQ